MFTGIVQSQAKVISADQQNNLLCLGIAVDLDLLNGLETGASIANNGVCLTVVDFKSIDENRGLINFDVIDETLKVSNLANISIGDSINIERSLKIGDELGGHIVSGHVHCMAQAQSIIKDSENCSITFLFDEKWYKYILPKGFITINGISLTVGKVTRNTFKVHLIPETLSRTNLGTLKITDKVNIEFDQQTITIVETLARMKNNNML